MELSAGNSGPSLTSGQQQATGSFSEVRDSYQRNSDWWTIFACFDLKDCEPTANAISQLTGISLGEVEAALTGLCMLGFLHKSNDLYTPVEGFDFMHFDYSEVSRTEIIDRHAVVAQQVLNDLDPARKMAFDHRCFAANDEILNELYRDMRAAFDKAFAKAQTSQGTNRIFKMTFTAVDVLTKPGTRGNSL